MGTTSLHNCQPKKLILQQQILYHFLKHIQQLLMNLLLQFKCQMQLELCQNYCKIFQLKNQQQQLPLLPIIRLPNQIRIVLNYYYMACFNQKVVLETYDDDAPLFSDESNSISILFPPLFF